MSTITTLNASDLITNSRADINTNFSNLNTDKIETSVLDTDTALTANSDAKVATQKAVKAYVDAGGNVNASETAKGIVEEATDAEVTAGTATGGTGAKLFVTPAKLLSSSGSPVKSVTAGATINGATLPVPVYQNKTDNEFYACDGNDTAAMKFLGFAISNGTNGAAFNVQFYGVVSGFTGLDEGEKYYLSDTVGTISTTAGTYEVLVGIAISTTQLLIQKGQRHASGTTTFTTTTGTVITCGFRPSVVRVYATTSTSTGHAISWGAWTVFGGNDCAYTGWSNAPTETSGVSATAWYLQMDIASVNHQGSITTITDTGFTLDNTETSDGVTANIMWEAEGEL